ncbi:MAG: arginase family protein [Candidatus Krumholzibacteriota bacterium]|nr:arginase family protein [Candidatus Krumholzibacteriota bacterium]
MIRRYDFLGEEASASRDRVVVVPVPIERSTSYIQGTAGAPAAILEASMQIELFNAGLGVDLENAGIVTSGERPDSREALRAFLDRERSALLESFPVFLGGEHSITPWIVEGLGIGDAGFVWLDAHADMRESYEGDPHSHACAARNTLPFGPIVEIGVRSCSRGEHDFIAASKDVEVFPRWCGEAADAIRRLPERIYLSFDFDAFDPSVVRALGTPEPGGLNWREVLSVLDLVFAEKTVVAMDAVELCPDPHDEASNFAAARTVYEAISRYLRKEGTDA